MGSDGDKDVDDRVRFITGDELGFLKVVDAPSVAGLGSAQIVQRWGDANKAAAVSYLSASALSSEDRLLAVGRVNGALELLSSDDGRCVARGALPSGERLCGLTMLPGAEGGGGSPRLLAGNSAGALVTYGAEGGELSEASRWSVKLQPEGSMDCLALSEGGGEVAIGGEGNELALYSMETQEQTFKVKPPKPDRLGMVPRPWVSAISFFPGEDSRKVLVGTGSNLGKGHVLVYDARAQRRAVLRIEFGETKVTAVAAAASGTQGFAATGAGDLARFDLRAPGKVDGAFKGPAGSVRSLALHPDYPLLASAGLDRFARVHSTSDRKAVGKVYAKVPMTAVVFARPPEVAAAATAAGGGAVAAAEEEEGEEEAAAGSKRVAPGKAGGAGPKRAKA